MRDELTQLTAQLVVRVAADVMELIDGDQTVVEGLDTELVHREAEGRMGAHQHPIIAG